MKFGVNGWKRYYQLWSDFDHKIARYQNLSHVHVACIDKNFKFFLESPANSHQISKLSLREWVSQI